MVHDEIMTNADYSCKNHDTLSHVVKYISWCVVFLLTSREYTPHRDLIVYSMLARRDLCCCRESGAAVNPVLPVLPENRFSGAAAVNLDVNPPIVS